MNTKYIVILLGVVIVLAAEVFIKEYLIRVVLVAIGLATVAYNARIANTLTKENK